MKFTSKYFTKEMLWLLGILITAFLVRFYRFNEMGMTEDEFFTLRVSDPSLSFQQFIARMRGEVTNPMFHYWLMWTLRGFFDDPLLALRVPSLIFSLLGIVAVHLLARRLYDIRTAQIAAVITCFCYVHIQYSLIGRPYALVFLLSTLSFLFFHALLVKERVRDLVLYTLSSLLLVHSHYFGFFIVIAQFLGLILWIARHRGGDHRTKLIYVAAFAVVFIVGTIPLAEKVVASSGLRSFWIEPLGLFSLGGIWLRYFAFDILLSFILFAGVLTSFFLIGRERKSTEAVASALLFLTILTSFGLPILYSYVRVPMLHYSYTLAALPFILILAAYGVRRWHLPRPAAAAFLAMGISFADSQLLLKGYLHGGGGGVSSFLPAVADVPGSQAYLFALQRYPLMVLALELPQIKEEVFAEHEGVINWYAKRFNIRKRVRSLSELRRYAKTGQPFWLLFVGAYQSTQNFSRWHRRINDGIHNHKYHSHEQVRYINGERRFFVAHTHPQRSGDTPKQPAVGN